METSTWIHTDMRVGSTMVLCCVMTDIRQVNCELFIQSDHSGL